MKLNKFEEAKNLEARIKSLCMLKERFSQGENLIEIKISRKFKLIDEEEQEESPIGLTSLDYTFSNKGEGAEEDREYIVKSIGLRIEELEFKFENL